MVLGIPILKHVNVLALPRKRKDLKKNENILSGSNTAAISLLACLNKERSGRAIALPLALAKC